MASLAARLGVSSSTFQTLQKKGLINLEKREVLRDPPGSRAYLPTEPLPLMEGQAAALKDIRETIDKPEGGVRASEWSHG